MAKKQIPDTSIEFNLSENKLLISEVKIDNHIEADKLNQLIVYVFKKHGLLSFRYMGAVREIAELWLKQNQSK